MFCFVVVVFFVSPSCRFVDYLTSKYIFAEMQVTSFVSFLFFCFFVFFLKYSSRWWSIPNSRWPKCRSTTTPSSARSTTANNTPPCSIVRFNALEWEKKKISSSSPNIFSFFFLFADEQQQKKKKKIQPKENSVQLVCLCHQLLSSRRSSPSSATTTTTTTVSFKKLNLLFRREWRIFTAKRLDNQKKSCCSFDCRLVKTDVSLNLHAPSTRFSFFFFFFFF